MCAATSDKELSVASLVASGRALQKALLDAVWRHWAELGASASAQSGARSVVDPEALILASLCLLDHEPRLNDLMIHWSILNSSFLSVQRLKNLASKFPAAIAPLLSGLAELL